MGIQETWLEVISNDSKAFRDAFDPKLRKQKRPYAPFEVVWRTLRNYGSRLTTTFTQAVIWIIRYLLMGEQHKAESIIMYLTHDFGLTRDEIKFGVREVADRYSYNLSILFPPKGEE